jgi:cytochrome c6
LPDSVPRGYNAAITIDFPSANHGSKIYDSGGTKMKTARTAVVLAAAASLLAFSVFAAEGKKGKTGEELFKQHCSMCHPEGGNIINAKKTLHGKDLMANNIRNAEDIVKVMRNPGPGMNKFDAKTLPDKEAKEIAEYVLKAFK